jgi:hypothetical protein
VDERLDDGLEPLLERLPDARDREEADERRAERKDAHGKEHRPRTLVRVLAVRVRRDELARLAVEDTEVEAEGVEAGEQRPEQRADVQDPSERAAVGERGADDRVLRPEAGEDRDPRERERADQERPARVRHRLRKTAHLADVLLAVQVVDHEPGREEEEGLEERVRDEVEHRERVRADARSDEHVADLAHRRVRDHALDVPLDEGDPAGARRVIEPRHGREVLDVGAAWKMRMRAADQ